MTNRDEYIEKLAKVAKMTADEARKALLDEVQSDLTGEIAKKIRADKSNQIFNRQIRSVAGRNNRIGFSDGQRSQFISGNKLNC